MQRRHIKKKQNFFIKKKDFKTYLICKDDIIKCTCKDDNLIFQFLYYNNNRDTGDMMLITIAMMNNLKMIEMMMMMIDMKMIDMKMIDMKMIEMMMMIEMMIEMMMTEMIMII